MKNQLKQIYEKAPYGVKVVMATLNGMKLKWWRSKDFAKRAEDFALREKWSKEDWELWQKERLTYMLQMAKEHVPYYRNMWKNRPGDSSLLHNWPVLTKDQIRKNPDLFISDKFNKSHLLPINSSGTSGTPMVFYFDRTSLSRWYALYNNRIKKANGIDDSMHWANIGGQLVAPVNRSRPPYWVWNAAMKQLYCSSYHLRQNTISDYANALIKFKIQYVYGYASSLYMLARLSMESKIELPKMRIAITNAEPLFDTQRSYIEQAFGCKVIQTYGGSEFAFGGSECEKNRIHLWQDAGYMEVVDFKTNNACAPGVHGKFLTTGLVNEAMPLIRYEIGDAGALGNRNCDCGNPVPLIEAIDGRNDDLILTKSGNRVGRLDPVFKSTLKIKEAQIVQLSLVKFEIKIVPTTGFDQKDQDDIKARLMERLGDIDVEFKIVESIKRGPNGKFKAVVSNINSI